MRATGSFGRLRVAFLLLSPTLFVVSALVVISMSTLADLEALGQLQPEAGLARIGSNLALVIVTIGGLSIEQLRTTIATWGLLVPAIVLVITSIVIWYFSGRITNTIEGAYTQAEQADVQRQAMLHEVIHELRTPLAVIATNLELAVGEIPQQTVKYLEAVKRAVVRMTRTVDDLEGHGGLAIEEDEMPIELDVVAESVALEHVGPGQAMGVRVALVGSDEVSVSAFDGAAVRTILGNFLSNAVRLSPRGGTVTLDWGSIDDWAWLSVSDEGGGMAPQFHARAFERGWQGSHSRHRHRGSGLGLTIARQLAEAQGGCVTLESEEGVGTVLALWLPMGTDSRRETVLAVDGVHPLQRPWSRQPSTV